jgi:hypothetical protein
MEKIVWLVLGGITFVAALRAGHSLRAMYVGRWALGVLFIVFGALVNGIYLAVATDYYVDFANASPFPFVRDSWESLVVPHQGFFIGLLIAAEATAGALILSRRRTGVHLGIPSSKSVSKGLTPSSPETGRAPAAQFSSALLMRRDTAERGRRQDARRMVQPAPGGRT